VASADALAKVKPILAKTTLIGRDPEYVLSLQMNEVEVTQVMRIGFTLPTTSNMQYLSRFSLTDDERFLGLARLGLDLHSVSG
jgi:hypothetical protein